MKELKAQGLYDSTLIVITAKHGQSPIDPSRYVLNSSTAPRPPRCFPTRATFRYSESTNNPTGIGPTEDDVSLFWLTSSVRHASRRRHPRSQCLRLGIALGQIYYGPSLALNYNDPTVDPRTPDIIVTPNVGVTYSGSTKKLAEHGGFAHDDTNVVLLLSNPSFKPNTVRASVGTAQVAPTILEALGLNPNLLQAVVAEGTPVLPVVPLK